jgi:hypothetical protein
MADAVTIVVRVRDQTRAGITAVNDNLNRLTRGAKDMDRSFGSLVGSALSLAPALIPIAASAAPIAVGLGAAGVAVAAFGAALGPQVMAMSEATDAEKKYQEAVEQHGPTSKEAAQAQAAYAKEMASLPPATREAAAQLSVLKDGYKDWSNALADDTMPVVTKGLATFGAIFPKLTPLVKGTSRELDRFVTIAAGGVQSAAFDRFMKSFAEFSTGALRKANDGLLKLMRTMDTGQVGGNLKEFMDYARTNGPIVGETLGNLGETLAKLLVAASDVGVGMLQVINAFASLVNAVPTSLLTTLLQIAIAFKAIKMAAAGFAAVGVGIQAITTQIIAMRTAAGTGATRVGMLGAAFTAMSRTAKIALASIGIGLALIAITELSQMGEKAAPNVDKLTTSLGELGRTGKASGYVVSQFGKDFEKLRDQINAVVDPSVAESINNWGADVTGGLLDAGVATEDFTKSVDSIDTSLANLVSGGKVDQAKAALASMMAGMKPEAAEKFRSSLDGFDEALANLAFEQKLAAEAMGLFGAQAQAVQGKLAAQKASADGLAQSINALSTAALIARGGIRGMEAAIDAVDESFKKNKATLDENTEAGRANNQALDNLAAATMKAGEDARANGASWETVNKIYARGREKLISAADAMGLTREQAKKLADQILRTPDKTARLRGNMEDLQRKINTAKDKLKKVPDSRRAQVRANINDLTSKLRQAARQLNAMDGQTATTYVYTNYLSDETARRRGRAHGGIIGAASGGPRSRMTLVGEQGPEIVDLAPGSRVRSNPDTRRMFASAGRGGGQPIVIQLDIAGRYLGEVVIDPLRKEISSRGGNVQAVLGRGSA